MKAKTISIMAAILIVTLACVSTLPTDPTPTPGRDDGSAAPGTALLTTEGQPPEPTENPAGAVFEIPSWWERSTTPTETPMPGKGRSNYE